MVASPMAITPFCIPLNILFRSIFLILSVGACGLEVLSLGFRYFTIYKQSLLEPGFYGSRMDQM